MAALIKLRHMPVVQRCLWNHLNKVSRNISTSKKNSDDVKDVCDVPVKNWVSYGFHYKDQTEDTNVHNASFFFSVTLCLVFGTFMWAYAPDVHMRDWAQREAYLELRRREKLGQPVISPHYIEPEKIKLPSEEDLCGVEIII
ncbi:NADH dehydrogenase [ubiquinone] 1 beta subcomplex subunit 11, mitochondrial [Pectinophora gossypiella]|uniref:NADH dehydrogenase [ubiquinone] 1 beta subcomplex subunit 11, mitochondrial n=1 Tax=Pectinophora gossypiella TaxID=13191 RepID=UPI00214F308B|nr:NADH dehydrogenase [ubiquinone] 1 beta subcomplex subunit 11, mitochondrial [Pectinophora gossypiella]